MLAAMKLIKGLAVDDEFERLGPWVTRFYIDGKPCGGDFDAFHDVRIDQFFQHFPKVKTILELGSLEGGHTLQLAKNAKVLGLEGRQKNIEKALYMQKLLGIKNSEFKLVDLEKEDLTSFGKFDAVMCCGILYHMPKPWNLLQQISRITDRVFIWTQYADKASEEVEGYPGCWFVERGLAHPISGLSDRSYWLTMDALRSILTDIGFMKIDIIEYGENNAGKCVTLTAQRPGLEDFEAAKK